MLSEQTVQTIEQLQSRYPIKRGALLMALHAAQSEKGFLTKEDFAEVGDLFVLDPAEVESVASFYTMYYTKPQGKCLFQLCTNISCMVEGAYGVLEHLRTTLGIAPGEVTDDGLFGLMEVECLAACDTGPCLQLSDREYYQRVKTEDIDRIIQHFRNGGAHPAPGAEANPLAFSGEVAFEPLAPLTPGEIKSRQGAEPPKAAATAPATTPAPAAPTATPRTVATPKAAPVAASNNADAAAAKAEAEAYARIEAAKRAQEREAADAVRLEAERAEKRAAEREAVKREFEAAEAVRMAEIEAREKALYQQATKLIIVRPPEPEPEPEPEVEAPPADLSILAEGMRIGGAAPALGTSPAAEAAVEREAEPAPEVAPKAPPEPQLNLETAEDLPTWQPENPYLRFLARDDAPSKEGTDA